MFIVTSEDRRTLDRLASTGNNPLDDSQLTEHIARLLDLHRPELLFDTAPTDGSPCPCGTPAEEIEPNDWRHYEPENGSIDELICLALPHRLYCPTCYNVYLNHGDDPEIPTAYLDVHDMCPPVAEALRMLASQLLPEHHLSSGQQLDAELWDTLHGTIDGSPALTNQIGYYRFTTSACRRRLACRHHRESAA